MVDEVFFILLLLFLAYLYFDRQARYWKVRGVKGPKALPLIGNLLDHIFLPLNLLEEQRMQKYGRVYGTMQGWNPVITIGEPKLLKQMLITDFRFFMNHKRLVEGDPLLSKSLVELEGDEWKRTRSLITPAFTAAKLKVMQPLFEECIQEIFHYLDCVEKQNGEIELKKISSAYTIDVIAKCIFGVNTNASQNPDDVFVRNANDMLDFPVWRILTKFTLPGFLQYKFDLQMVPEKLVNYFTLIIANILKQRRETKSNRVDFIQLLFNSENENLNSGKNLHRIKLTDEDIIANCYVFLVAGYETTATFIQYTLYILAMYPKIQQRLFEEINEYFKSHEKVDFESLNSLPYFEAVLSESMRMYTPVTIFEHICGEDYKLGDITIEKGVIVNLPLYAMHHDPEFFPNPHEFIPERFLPENRHMIRECSFIPFALGPRMCVGNRFSQMQTKLFLAQFVKNFHVMKTKNTAEKVEFTGRFFFLTCKPLFVKIANRIEQKSQ